MNDVVTLSCLSSNDACYSISDLNPSSISVFAIQVIGAFITTTVDSVMSETGFAASFPVFLPWLI